MNYAKYIDLPNWERLQAQLIEFRETHGNKEVYWWTHSLNEVEEHLPDLAQTFKSMGLTIRQLVFFTTANNDINIDDPMDMRAVFIHTDSPDDSEARSKYAVSVFTDWETSNAINIPLLNCDGTTTLFYKLKDETAQEVYYKANDGAGHSKSDVEEVYRFELNKPAIIRVNVPHAVWNPNTDPRVVVTIRFVESTDHLLD